MRTPLSWLHIFGLTLVAVLKPEPVPAITSTYSFTSIGVDQAITITETYTANSGLDCVVSCQINPNCTAVGFDPVGKSCNIILRDSITWDSPTKNIFVESEGKV